MKICTTKSKILALICILTLLTTTGCSFNNNLTTDIQSTAESTTTNQLTSNTPQFNYNLIPEYTGNAFVEYNNNMPLFTPDEITTNSFESYTDLDELGRCGVTMACLSTETMPTEERGEIGSVKPSGWQTIKYNDIIDGNYLYNRCHLIGYQLSGENANIKNLITGTRYLNIEGMLPFENETADYIKETNNHVMYRVTPVFINDELVARGVLMEGYSVEDNGTGLQFCAFCYNVQPNITIDYKTGKSQLIETTKPSDTSETTTGTTYILNINSKKYHIDPNCSAVKSMSESNKKEITITDNNPLPTDYTPCKLCCK